VAIVPLYPRNVSERLERICAQLIRLLNGSEDPMREMRDALSMLDAHDLWHGNMDPTCIDRGIPRFHAFARNVIVENDAVRDAVAAASREFEPLNCETVEDLLTNLIPAVWD
jgi:hypothetical protein